MDAENIPQFPVILPDPIPPPERDIHYYFFHVNELPNATLQTLIIYSAADNPFLPQFFNGLLELAYIPSRHALVTAPKQPPPPIPRIIFPTHLHFLPPFGPIHLTGEDQPELPPFLHFPHLGPPPPPPPPLLPPQHNPGYPQNLIPGQRAFFFFRRGFGGDENGGVVIVSTTDNPWNNPLVAGFLDLDFEPGIQSFTPRLRYERPPYPRFYVPPYLRNIAPEYEIQLINAPLPLQEEFTVDSAIAEASSSSNNISYNS